LQGRLDLDGTLSETKLFEYGIFQEESDIRAHVSNRTIYVFKTSEVIKCLTKYKFRQVPAYQPGYDKPTAMGYLVQPDKINDIRKLKFVSWYGWDSYSEDWSTTVKGNWAVECVIELIRIGRFPFWIEAKQTQDKVIDIKGTDVLICMNQKIQVKCDYPAIKTGNLYIQTHEINPFKNY